MAVNKKCVVCGKIYQARTNSKTCSEECKKIRYRQVNTRAHKAMYHNNKRLNGIDGYRAVSLESDNEKARKMGLTYGQYKAMQFLFRQKAEEVANEK